MFKQFLKKVLLLCGVKPIQAVRLWRYLRERICKWSIVLALREKKFDALVTYLRKIVPDISNQETGLKRFNDYWEVKLRGTQAFQCSLMLRTLQDRISAKLLIVDIGDSAGTHMLYLRALAKDRFNIDVDTISVNLDPRAIERIKARGLNAVLCRAESLDLGDRPIDLVTSFEMVEHLHNPTFFFRRLAKNSTCNKIIITVPYLKKSRVGLHHIRNKSNNIIFAEDAHIFELSPEDWTLLFLHSGWNVAYSEIYYQYPQNLPGITHILAMFWRRVDYEGFWGALLEKDTTYSDRYQDWEI